MPVSRRAFTQILTTAAAGASLRRNAEAQNSGIFQHGVASGDPLLNRVVIWTRLTTTSDEEVIPVEWVIAEDANFSRNAQRGLTYTNGNFDYTVKVDVERLNPATTYYYRFTFRGSSSPVGRTKTLPLASVERARFAVVSCSNLPYGYFNTYRLVANRRDLDFVLHLGDYIYEYANRQYGNGTPLNRVPAPDKEISTLSDYRTRYAQYRSDQDLQEMHRQHATIVVWDDHESTNDSWKEGAENHQPDTEGAWSPRRAVSAQAWFEWMPVRANPYVNGEIYRNFRFGSLIDLIMLDTRLAGRSQQVVTTSPAIFDQSRSLMGPDQEAWLNYQLGTSQGRGTQWRLLGQQTMMGQLVGADGAPFNSDQWDGYVASRNRLLQTIATNNINNVVVLTGDIHSSWGNEIAGNPFLPTGYNPLAVEFVTPAVSSPGIDDRAQADGLQAQIGATHPHVKYVELFRRGYLLMDVDRERAQGEWYHVRTILERTTDEDFARALVAASGSNRLVAQSTASRPGANPAPAAP
ncbi:MAG: alkaline phosphatase D family protein [Bryobacteraceae bacterium]|nr:alkaline phosphatase D family protein [Bryobacteraceae bacterium]